MAVILLVIAYLFALPCIASSDAGDVQDAVDKQFGRGKVISISVDNGRVTKFIYSFNFENTGPPAEKTQIQNYINGFDLGQKGAKEIQMEINSELQKLADDPNVDDAKYLEVRTKLLRAKEMSNVEAKQAKLDEAKQSK